MYAASLALRGELAVDGYGVFAGGSSNRYDGLLAGQAERRVPILVGYGSVSRCAKTLAYFRN